jgi:hypothetical protein
MHHYKCLTQYVRSFGEVSFFAAAVILLRQGGGTRGSNPSLRQLRPPRAALKLSLSAK